MKKEVFKQIIKNSPDIQGDYESKLRQIKDMLCVRDSQDLLLSPNEVATELKINVRSVFKLIRGKELKASKVRKVYRIKRQDLKKYLKANEVRG